MSDPTKREPRAGVWLCWTGALTAPFVVAVGWFAASTWLSLDDSPADWLGLPAALLAGIACLSRLPTPLANRVFLSILYAILMLPALIVVSFLFVCTYVRPCFRLF